MTQTDVAQSAVVALGLSEVLQQLTATADMIVSGVFDDGSYTLAELRQALFIDGRRELQELLVFPSLGIADVGCLLLGDEVEDVTLAASARKLADGLGMVTKPLVVSNACISGLAGMVEGRRLLLARLQEIYGPSVFSDSTTLSETPNGADDFGFSALSAGQRNGEGDFYDEGTGALFWGATEFGSDYAYRLYLYYDADDVHLGYFFKDYAFSVRCLKD